MSDSKKWSIIIKTLKKGLLNNKPMSRKTTKQKQKQKQTKTKTKQNKTKTKKKKKKSLISMRLCK